MTKMSRKKMEIKKIVEKMKIGKRRGLGKDEQEKSGDQDVGRKDENMTTRTKMSRKKNL
jgi:hypothetical protein